MEPYRTNSRADYPLEQAIAVATEVCRTKPVGPVRAVAHQLMAAANSGFVLNAALVESLVDAAITEGLSPEYWTMFLSLANTLADEATSAITAGHDESSFDVDGVELQVFTAVGNAEQISLLRDTRLVFGRAHKTDDNTFVAALTPSGQAIRELLKLPLRKTAQPAVHRGARP